jgi:hypothetical protein
MRVELGSTTQSLEDGSSVTVEGNRNMIFLFPSVTCFRPSALILTSPDGRICIPPMLQALFDEADLADSENRQ